MMKLEIPDHPFYPNEAIVPDDALLEALVAGYEHELDGAEPVPMIFLASWAPVGIFERIFAQDPRTIPVRGFAWMLYLSGYFSGIWLRTQIQNAQLESMHARHALPASKKAFDAIVSRARAGIGVPDRTDEAVLDHCEGILPELVEGFGYYKGSLLQILELPPEGSSARPGGLIVGGPLWCGHADPRLEALADLYDVSSKLLQSHDPEWNRLLDWILDTELAEVERGRLVCRTSFSAQGWSRSSYEQFVSLMGIFLEVFQAVALTTVHAVADGNTGSGHRACIAHACLTSWRDAFMLGLNDRRPDGDTESALPRFSGAPPASEATRERL